MGEPLRVRFDEGDVVMRVLRVRQQVPTRRYSRPERGTRLVGVDLEIRNVGQKVFSPPLSALVKLVDSEGGQGEYSLVAEGKCGRSFALSVSITLGSREQGCLPFQIDKGTRPRRFQVSLGYGDDQVIAEFHLSGGGGGAQPEPQPEPEPLPPTGGSGTPS